MQHRGDWRIESSANGALGGDCGAFPESAGVGAGDRRGAGGIAHRRRFGWEFFGGTGNSHAGWLGRGGRRGARGEREPVGGPHGGPHGATGETAGGAVVHRLRSLVTYREPLA